MFYSSVQPEGDLYIARTDGTGFRQLTSGTEPIDRMPRWSPDGQWIAFHWIRGKDRSLWKIRPDVSSSSSSVRSRMRSILHGRRTVNDRGAHGRGIGDSENNVYIFDPDRPWIDQKPEVILPPAESPDEFVVNAWSPDGSQLAGQAGLGARGIITYSLRSRGYGRLTDFGGYPVWLPDSRHLMFVSGGRDFFVVDTRSRKVEKVFSVPGDTIGPPQLTRDGRRRLLTACDRR